MQSRPDCSPDFIDLIRSSERLETMFDLALQWLDRQDADISAIRTRFEDLEESRDHSRGIVAALTKEPPALPVDGTQRDAAHYVLDLHEA